MEGLKPCPFRHADKHGRILCGLAKGNDREVSVNLCRACPVAQINCQHLRASLEKHVPTPITVRYATGRVEVWDDTPPTIEFQHAACAVKTMPIHSPRDCVGCPLRLPQVVPQNAIPMARARKQNASSSPATSADHLPGPHTHASAITTKKTHTRAAQARDARSVPTPTTPPSATKSKIILFQEWLDEQRHKKAARAKASHPQGQDYVDSLPTADADGVSEIVYAPLAPAYHEDSAYERCVGWTD